MLSGVDWIRGPCAGWFPFAFMAQENGSDAPLRRWLRLTVDPLTAINCAGQRGYRLVVTHG
jgi:hypothetical protein